MSGDKRRSIQRQVAALPLRLNGAGVPEALLVTSRRTRRWVLPKGNLMKDVSDARAAAIEAEEEAGVFGHVRKSPYARYDYWKRRALSFELCRVDVYLLAVTREDAVWKERGQREREWVSLTLASRMVLEPGLQSIFRALAKDDAVVALLGDRRARAMPGGAGLGAV